MNETYNFHTTYNIVNPANSAEMAELKADLDCALETLDDYEEHIANSDDRIARLVAAQAKVTIDKAEADAVIEGLRDQVTEKDSLLQRWRPDR